MKTIKNASNECVKVRNHTTGEDKNKKSLEERIRDGEVYTPESPAYLAKRRKEIMRMLNLNRNKRR